MKIGFTGTRSGMSSHQKWLVRLMLENLQGSIDSVVHGGCVGADADFHEIADSIGLKKEIRPGYFKNDPDNKEFVADLTAEVVHEPDTHFSRNRKIVDESDMVIACPWDESATKGGTAFTMGYATKQRKKLIVFPRESKV